MGLTCGLTVQCNYSSYRILYNQRKRIGGYHMGTNFYLMSRNKKLMREYFAVETEYTIKDIEYEIVDEPYLGYEVHLCKLSAGWRPLFQRHKTISTSKELEEFCLKNKSMVSIGSGVRNLYKYTPIYSDGGKPELIEDDVFRITIPLDKVAADEEREKKTLSEREQKIYNMICENLHLSVEQVMAELDISRATVFRDYSKIKKVTCAMYDKKTSTWTLD